MAVTSRQVAAYRLGRQHLLDRAPRGRFVEVLREIGGAQAQLLPAAYLALGTRVRELTPAALDRATFRDRRLVKAWCLRRTIHLLARDDTAVFVRATTRRAAKEILWMRHKEVPARAIDALIDAVVAALDQPRTRVELAEAVARTLGRPVLWQEGGGWGSARSVPCVKVGPILCPAYFFLHLAAARAVICAGPDRDGEGTYVRADAWVPGWRDLPTERAEEELLRRYLAAFGPATPHDFHAWTRIGVTGARAIWARLAEEIAPVEVDGRTAGILRRDLDALRAAEFDPPSVRLLPYFDAFLLGHAGRDHLLPPERRTEVYRPAGWIAPVVLVDGRVAGVWRYDREAPELRVRAELWRSPSRGIERAIRDEAREVGRFLGSDQPTISVVGARPLRFTPARRRTVPTGNGRTSPGSG